MDDELRELRWNVVRRIKDLHERNGLSMRRAVAVALKEHGLSSLDEVSATTCRQGNPAGSAERFEYATQLRLPLLGVDDDTLRALPPHSRSIH